MNRLIVLAFLFLFVYGAKAQTEICNNGLDDDKDGFIDCFDKDCTSSSLCDGYYLGNDVICQAKPTSFPSFSMKLKWSSPNKTTNHLNRASVGDLNRDGVPEVIVTEIQNNVINILDGKTGSLKKSLTVSYELDREVVVGNLNNDNCAEVFTSGQVSTKVGKKTVKTLHIFAYDCNLNLLWTSTALSASAMMFGLADFDGDGKVEIFSRDEILDASTGIRIVKGTDSNNTVGAPVAVDILNNDNKLELVAGCKIFEVNLGARTLDVGSLVLKKSVPSFFIRQSHSSTSVADYNLDGSLDVIASGSDGSQDANTTVFFWDVKTDVVKKYIDKIAGDIFIAGCSNTTGKYYENGWQNGTGRVNIADIDGDGKLNASYVSGKYLYALKEDFTLKWRVSVNEETSGYTGCSVYDFNGDGAAEVVYRDEQYLYIINGKDGSVNTQQQCIARTAVEYPIVADIDGDGSTELCVTCGFDDKLAWDNFCTLSYSENSHVRVFQSASLPWVPSRKLWNQHAYFNVNVNDDLTIPKIQQKHHLVFSTGTCTQGPNRPLNTFLNQTPYLDTNGCPTYASPDMVNVQALFKIQPPTCPGNDFFVTVGVKNQGDVAIAGDVPITFYNGDPTKAGATKLNTVTIPVNLATNTTATFTNLKVTGTGGSFKLFISLNDAGTSLPTPIKLPNTSFLECNYDNVISADVIPKSVKLTALKVNDNVKCLGSTVPDNGAARAFISVSGVENTTDYDFFWFNGPVAGAHNFKGAVYSGLAAGTYKVFARHKTALCNSDTATVVINRVDKAMTASIVVDKPNTSCSIPNGEMHAVVNGGDPVINFTFKWYEGNDIFTSPEVGVGSIAKNLKGGKTYTVLVTDIASGCQAVASLPVPDNTTAPTLTASKVDAVCVPANSGSASANVGGVTTGFTFRWYNGTATKPAADFTGAAYNSIPAGSYTVTAENTTTGCVSAPTTVVVGLPPSFAVTASMVAQQTSCLTPNGSATANVAGVTAGFTFDWFSGQTTAPASAIAGPTGLAAGTYTVRATKTSTGCTDTEEVTITQSQVFPVVTLTPTANSTCSPTLGTSAFNGAVAGTVTYNGIAVTDFTNYQLTWHNGALITDPTIAGATTPNLSQLNGGSYTLEVKRTDLGCAAAPVTAVVTNTLTLPVLTTAQTPSKNCVVGKEDGIAEVTQVSGTAVGSTTNFNYQWHTGTTTATPIASATNAKLQNVQGGATSNYTVLVTNKTTGCQNTATVLVADAKVVPTITLAAQNNTICDPALTSPAKNFNGKVTATVTNQVGALTDYTFAFGGGNTTTPTALQSANIFDRLNGGPTAYTATATHTITGCVSAQASVQVNNVQDLPDLVTDDDASTNCAGGSPDGKATLVSVDGVAPAPASGYSYSWNAGAAVALPVLSTGSSVSNVQGGPTSNYTVVVTNLSNGCKGTTTVLVADAKQNPVLTLTSTPNGGCTVGTFTGTASQNSLTDTNVKPGDTYVYVWSAGNVIGADIGTGTSSIVNRNGGFYTATAKNNRTNCTSSPVTVEIVNNQVLPTITTTTTASTNCVGGTVDGAATANVGGVTTGFSFQWFSGTAVTDPQVPAGNGGNTAAISAMAAASYTVQVTNSTTGCANTKTVAIADGKQLPVLALTSTPNGGCIVGTFTGTASQNSLTDTNSKPGDTYGYVWSAGLVIGADIGTGTSSIVNRNGGFYTATVKNNRTNCTSSPVTVEILNNQVLPTITTTTVASTNCVGGTVDGAASANVGGTTVGFSFQWFSGTAITDPQVPVGNGGNTAAINNMAAASYTVQVTNSTTGCANTKTVAVADGKQPPVLTLTSTPNGGCTVSTFTGTASQNSLTDANVKPGDTYAYVWSAGLVIGADIGTGTSSIVNRDGGFYTATVKNNRTNCTSSPVTVEIVNNKVLPTITTTTTASTNCVGGTVDGAASANVGGTTVGFSFQWYSGTAITDPQVAVGNGGNTPAISNVAAASYTVQVTNATTGCDNTKTVAIADGKQLPVFTLTSTPNVGCTVGNFTGTASQNALTDVNTKPGDTYSYVWSAGLVIGADIGTGISSIANKDGGFYTATVKNNRTNCTSSPVTVEIVNNKVLPTITTTTTASTNCVGGTVDGAASANVGGVTTGFSFQWFAGTAITDPQVPAGNGGNTADISSVAASSYTVQVTNATTGCDNTKTVAIADGKQPPVLTLTSTPNGGCIVGNFTGTASENTLTDVTTKPGDTYSYVWSAGLVIGVDIGTGTNTIINKDGGFYTATVKNNRTNCTSSPVTVEIVNSKVLPTITTTTTASTNCAGGTADGAASANVGGTTVGFSFQWYSGTATTDPQVAVGNGGNTPAISNVTAASYTVQVTNATTGCENTKTVAIADGKQNPVLTLTSTPNIGCTTGFTGTASQNTLTDVNTKPGDTYLYVWSAGNVIGADIGTGTSSIINRNGGFYTANVTNNRTNCTSAPVTVNIANNITLPALATNATGSTNCDPAKDNGVATLASVNAAVPNATTHTFQWYNGTSAAVANLRAGDTGTSIGSTTPGLGIQGGISSNFTVLVTEISTGCQNTALVNVPDAKVNPILNINLLTNNTICVGTKNGSLQAVVSYGTPPVVQASPLAANWQVTWMPGALTGETISNLAAGSYSATVTDSNTGCTSGSDTETVVDVLQYPVISTNILHEQTACPPAGGNGQLRGSATTTSGTLQFTWYTGVGTGGAQLVQSTGQVSAATLSTLANLASTNYTFNALNEVTGCESNKVVLLPQTLTYPTFTGAITNVTQCVPTNGKVDITLGTITDPTDFRIYYLNELNNAHTGDPTTIKAGATIFYDDDPSKLSYKGLFSGPAPGDHDLEPGTYTVLLVDGVTQCESNPTTFTLLDNTNKSIAVTAIAEASACNSGVGGSIDISVLPAIPYTYTWHSGVPTNTGFNFMNNAVLPIFPGGDPVSQITQDLTGYAPGDVAGVGNGMYTVVVVDATGCGKVFTETVPYLESPDITLTLLNSTKCDPALSDASIQVDVTPTVAVPVGTKYSVQLFKGHNSSIPLTYVNGEDDGCSDGIDNDGDGDIDAADSDCGDDNAAFSTTFNATSPILPTNPTPVAPLLGNYLVRVFDNAGSGCAIEKAITLEIDPKIPSVNVDLLVGNTSCDPVFGDGTATITVNKDPLDVARAAPTAVGSDVFLGTYASNPSYSITAITPNPVAGAFGGQALVTGASTLIAANFASQLYTITVTDAVSGCEVDQAINIPSNPGVPGTFTVATAADEFCSPSTNGSATVTAIDLASDPSDDATDYNFQWFNDAGLTTLVVPVVNPGDGVGTGGELLNSTKVTAAALWPVNAIAGLGNGSKTYYVRAQKQNAPGNRCFTAVQQVNILDDHTVPAATIVPFSNTSCNVAVDEGKIELTAATNSGNATIDAADYTYTWSADPTGTSPVTGQDGTVTYTITPLPNATYTITTENEVSGCIVTNTAEILNIPYTLSITDFSVLNQELCPIGGQIDVTEVTIDRGNTGLGPITTPATGALATEYTFEWFTSLPGDPGSFDDTSPLEDNATNPITGTSLVAGTAAGEFPTMGFGTYYVIATRTNTAALPAANCPSVPFRVEVLDKRIFPTVSFSTVSNSSCDNNFDGRIIVTANTASGPGVGSNYDFTWTDPDGAGPISVANATNQVSPYSTPNTDRIAGATYAVQVTNRLSGCSTDASVSVADKTLPMVITSVTPTHVDLCGPGNTSASNGQGTVVDVLLDNVSRPGEFTFTWATVPTMAGGVATNNPPLNQTGLAIGTHYTQGLRTAIALDGPGSLGFGSNGSGCLTPPASFEVLDKRVYPTVGFATVSNSSCDTNFDGRITVTASTASGPGAAATYDFTWTDPDGAGPISVANATNQGSPYATAVTDRIDGATYAIQVTNRTTTCFTDASVTVVDKTLPMVITSVTPTHVDLCGPGNTSASNGQGTVVDVLLDNVSRPGEFTFTWATVPTMAGGVATNNPPLNHTGLAIGTHYTQGLRTAIALDGPGSLGFGSNGSGCSTPPASFVILDKRVYPTVGFATVSNSSCDTNFDGRITVTASTASGPGAAATYDFTWTDPDGAGPISVANATNQGSPYATAVTDRIDGATYAIQVTNRTTTCFTDASVTVVDKTLPMVITSVTPTHVDLCGPGNTSASNGQGTVVDVLLDNVSRPGEFTFTWATVPTMAGGVATNNPPLNHTGLAIGTHYTQGLRTAIALDGPGTLGFGSNGSGCSTPPASFVILDKRVYPTVGFATVSNSSCDTNFDGRITVTASTASGPGAAATYDFTWTDPDGAGPISVANATNQGSPYATAVTDRIDGATYAIQVTNRTTTCFTDASVTVVDKTLPMVITSVTPTHVDLCGPGNTSASNGQGTVVDVLLDNVSRPGEFTFTWATVPTMAGGVATNNPPLNHTGLAIGTHYTQGLRTAIALNGPGSLGFGSNGSGCSTAPISFEILDKRVFPTVVLTSTPNTACDTNFDGRITVTTTTASGPGVGANYNLTWTDPDAAGPISVANAANQASPYITPLTDRIGAANNYSVQVTNVVTGCFTDAATKVISNPPLLTLTAVGQDQDICLPDGRIDVTTVSSGAVADYSYTWFRSSVTSTALTDASSVTIAGSILQPGNGAGQYPTMGAGTYFVQGTKLATMTPGSGCVSAPVRVDVKDIHVDPVIPAATVNPDVFCAGGAGAGSITLLATSPLNFTYSWFTGNDITGTPVTSVAGVNGEIVQNLQEGAYTVQVRETATNCTSISHYTIANNPLIAAFDATGFAAPAITSCDVTTGQPLNGSATVTSILENGTSQALTNYTFQWTDDANAVLQTGASPVLSNIPAGTYFVKATQSISNCVAQLEFEIEDQTIGSTTVTLVDFDEPERCVDPKVGYMTVLGGGNGASYSYEWFAGDQRPTPSGTPVAVGATLNSITVPTGQTDVTFTVKTINDTNNCWAVEAFDVPLIVNPVILNASANPLTFCTSDNGEVFATIVNDNKFEYDFGWSNGASAKATPDFTGNNVGNLAAGTYTVVATDRADAGCVSPSVTVVIDNMQVIPVVSARLLKALTICDPARPDGVAAADVGGDITRYTFDWFAGAAATGTPFYRGAEVGSLSASTFSVLATETLTGCSASASVVVPTNFAAIPKPTIVVVSNVTSCLVDNGELSASVDGVTKDYIFDWANGTTAPPPIAFTGEFYKDLSVGQYTVIATSRITGCVSPPATAPIIKDQQIPDFDFLVQNASCSIANGFVTLLFGNDLSIDKVTWYQNGSLVAEGPNLENAFAGFYDVTVQTTLGCENTKEVELPVDILVYNGVSRLEDGKNDIFLIECIENFPNNHVEIFNRAGTKVYEADGYNNTDVLFDGKSNKGISLMGTNLPSGTYFYVISKGDGSERIVGYLELVD